MTGIYIIWCSGNNKFYLGSSIDIVKRFSQHKRDLQQHVHANAYLQNAWNKYGEDAFEFLVFELVDRPRLLETEQSYLDLLDWSCVMNISNSASGGNLIANHPHANELRTQATQRLLSYQQNLTPEERSARIQGSKNPNWRGGISKEQKYCSRCGKKRSKSSRTICRECYDINGTNNPFYGKQHTEITKIKISDANKGKKPSNMRQVHTDNGVYESVSEAARQLKVSPALIIYRCKSKKYKSYYYINA